jgi:hypothetical protein
MSKLTINNVTMTLSHCSKIINFNRNLHTQNNSNAIKTKNNIDVLPKGKAEKRKRLALMKIWTTQTSYPNKGWTTQTHSSKYSWKTQMSSPNNS